MNAIPDWLAEFASLPEWRQQQLLRNAPEPLRRRLFEEWSWQAHDGQGEPPGFGEMSGVDHPPDGRPNIWLMMAGRGFGKTRAGAEWVSDLARAMARGADRPGRGDDRRGRQGDVEGESGLIGGGAARRAGAVERRRR